LRGLELLLAWEFERDGRIVKLGVFILLLNLTIFGSILLLILDVILLLDLTISILLNIVSKCLAPAHWD